PAKELGLLQDGDGLAEGLHQQAGDHRAAAAAHNHKIVFLVETAHLIIPPKGPERHSAHPFPTAEGSARGPGQSCSICARNYTSSPTYAAFRPRFALAFAGFRLQQGVLNEKNWSDGRCWSSDGGVGLRRRQPGRQVDG